MDIIILLFILFILVIIIAPVDKKARDEFNERRHKDDEFPTMGL